jgi:hypothetical protein
MKKTIINIPTNTEPYFCDNRVFSLVLFKSLFLLLVQLELSLRIRYFGYHTLHSLPNFFKIPKQWKSCNSLWFVPRTMVNFFYIIAIEEFHWTEIH